MEEQSNVKKAPPKKSSKIVNIVVDIILVLAIVLAIFCAYSAYFMKDDNTVPSLLGIKLFIVESDSMVPTFKTGDLLIGKEIKDFSKLEAKSDKSKGDIIFFHGLDTEEKQGIKIIVHRIVDIKSYDNKDGGYYRFWTYGDANTAQYEFDKDISENRIEGQYLFRLAGFGTFIKFMQSKLGFFLIIVLPVALFFLWQLIQFFRSLFAYQAEKVRVQYQEQMKQNGMYMAPQQGMPGAFPAQPQQPVPPEPQTQPTQPEQSAAPEQTGDASAPSDEPNK